MGGQNKLNKVGRWRLPGLDHAGDSVLGFYLILGKILDLWERPDVVSALGGQETSLEKN